MRRARVLVPVLFGQLVQRHAGDAIGEATEPLEVFFIGRAAAHLAERNGVVERAIERRGGHGRLV